MPAFDIAYHLGIDGISLFFVILSTLLTPICMCVGASWEAMKDRVKEYMIAFLVLETLMIGMFCVPRPDTVLRLLRRRADPDVPHYRGLGRSRGGSTAAFKFFLYTLAGSVLMLLAILAMAFQAGTTDITKLLTHDFPIRLQPWLWLAFLRVVRCQGAHVAGAYLAARCPRGGADGGVGHPGGCAFEIRRLRFPQVLIAHVPGRIRRLRAVHLRPERGRDHLHVPRGAGPGGYEKADRVLLGCPYGLRHPGGRLPPPSRVSRARSFRC